MRRWSGTRCLLCLVLAVLVCMPVILPATHTHAPGQSCVDCPICLVAFRLQMLLLELFAALLTAAPAARVLGQIGATRPAHASPKRTQSPVVLRVRMNN